MKELRNTFGSRMSSILSQTSLWDVVSMAHLRVGHTHEDIDAVFALCAKALATADRLETPGDVMRRLTNKMAHLWTDRGLAFNIEYVDVVAGIEFSCIGLYVSFASYYLLYYCKLTPWGS